MIRVSLIGLHARDSQPDASPGLVKDARNSCLLRGYPDISSSEPCFSVLPDRNAKTFPAFEIGEQVYQEILQDCQSFVSLQSQPFKGDPQLIDLGYNLF